MAEVDVQEELPDQERRARAVFEVRLQPGETLIWADRADPNRLKSYYFRKPLLYGSVAFLVVLAFCVVAVTDGFAHAIPLITILIFVIMALFAGSLVFIWEMITRQAWRWQDINHHYYGLTDRRVLRSIGGGSPRAFKYEEISSLNVEGPQDEEALGDIQFYRDTGMDHQTYFRFHGVRRARKVTAVIKAQLAMGSQSL